jgi:hypothetical protein
MVTGWQLAVLHTAASLWARKDRGKDKTSPVNGGTLILSDSQTNTPSVSKYLSRLIFILILIIYFIKKIKVMKKN